MEITALVSDALDRLKAERDIHAHYHAQAVVGFKVDPNEQVHKYMLKSIPSDCTITRNIVGDAVGTTLGHQQYLSKDVISRDSVLGQALLSREELDSFEYSHNGRSLKATLYYRAQYEIKADKLDLVNGNVLTKEGFYSPSSFQEYIEKFKQLTKELEQLSQDNDAENAEINKIEKERKELERRRKEIKLKITEYKKSSNRLAAIFSPDPSQIKAKNSHMFKGTLIIEGGPGTGKTTTLIHRIQFLRNYIESSEQPDFNKTLGPSDLQLLDITEPQPWVFFSPTQLLRDYLKEALSKENIPATSNTVRTWSDEANGYSGYKHILARDHFKFIGDNRPFTMNKNAGPHLFNPNALAIAEIEGKFNDFVLEEIIKKAKTIKEFDYSKIMLSEKMDKLKSAIIDLGLRKKIVEIIRNMENIKQEYEEMMNEDERQLKDNLDSASSKLAVRIKQNAELYNKLIREMDVARPLSETDDDDDDETELEGEETFINTDITLENRFYQTLRNVIRAIALHEVDPGHKFSDRQATIIKEIKSYLPQNNYKELSKGVLCVKQFKPFTKGSETLILNTLPKNFKIFRVKVLRKDYESSYNKGALSNLNKQENSGKLLHGDELDLLLLFLFRSCHTYLATNPNIFYSSKNRYLSAYRAVCRPIVAIDEATDFPLLQLSAITLLAHPRFNGVTLVGDLMQRMTAQGITTWTDYEQIFKDTKRIALVRSYRQTPRLLSLARSLYKKTVGVKPKYTSAGRLKFPFKPKAVCFASQDEDEKLIWFERQVLELKNALLSQLPNIAILAENEEKVSYLVERINDLERLQENGIEAKACSRGQLGDVGQIRVFPVKYVKGLEFECVFFWDIDSYSTIPELDKLLYVGISRASLFLAITVRKKLPPALWPFRKFFIQEWKLMDSLVEEEDTGDLIEELA